MDMGKSFIRWVSEHLPKVQIVFDHFLVVQMMNKKEGKVKMMKKALHSIYWVATNAFQAETASQNWINDAKMLPSDELHKMVKTLETLLRWNSRVLHKVQKNRFL